MYNKVNIKIHNYVFLAIIYLLNSSVVTHYKKEWRKAFLCTQTIDYILKCEVALCIVCSYTPLVTEVQETSLCESRCYGICG